ncbi:MAG: hypothetical protein LBD29_07490, partial [Treponema sp.]|nr:hypothetical protein [Treponema sp.]
MKKRWFVGINLFLVFFFSCATFNRKEPYPNMDIFNDNHTTAYEFKNSDSDKLVIYIDGTSYYSVLGYKNGGNWDYVSFGYFLVKLLRDDFVILIPERLNMQIGTYYYLDPEIRKNYVLENLVETYSSTINLYLKEH